MDLFPKMPGQATTLNEVLKNIGADFIAEKKPVFQALPDGTYTQIDGYSTIVNGDKPLSIVSARYGLAQYAETLSFLDDVVGQQAAQFNSALMIDDGAKVFISLKAPNSVVFAPGDEIECYYTASTGHTGTDSIVFMCSPVHTRTQTVLTSLHAGLIKIRHSVHVNQKVNVAKATATKMNDVWSNHANSFKNFASVAINDDEAKLYFAMLTSDNESTRTENIREKLFDIYKVGVVSKIPSCQNTALGAFVAALVYGDYYKGSRKSVIGRTERDIRIESRLSGSAARFKAEAFAAAIKMMK